MPAREDMDRIHDAVLWTGVEDDRYNEKRRGQPVPLKVRWKQTVREGTDRNGNPVVLEAQVKVDREIPIGALMWKGKLEKFDDATADNIMEVVFYNEDSDLKGRHTARSVDLKRFMEDLPPEA